jgi:hypothetical protein
LQESYLFSKGIFFYKEENQIRAAKVETDQKTGKAMFRVVNKDLIPNLIMKISFQNQPEMIPYMNSKYAIFKNSERLFIIEIDTQKVVSVIKFDCDLAKIFKDRC